MHLALHTDALAAAADALGAARGAADAHGAADARGDTRGGSGGSPDALGDALGTPDVHRGAAMYLALWMLQALSAVKFWMTLSMTSSCDVTGKSSRKKREN